MTAVGLRQYFINIYAVILTAVFAMAAHAVTDPFPDAARSYALYVNGELLWAHKPELRVSPASLSKIMTALIVLERTSLNDIVAISRSAEMETGSRLKLKAGDKYYVIDLLAASLIHSANDACRSLAEHVSGNEARFVRLMNKRAREMGMRNTRFSNACGHDNRNQYSTAHDLAKLAFFALKNETFAKIVSLVDGTITTVNERRAFYLENTNALIGRYSGAIGVKTGFTAQAGKCLIALAERNGIRVMIVLLNAPDRWWKAVEMLDRAFLTAEYNNAKQ